MMNNIEVAKRMLKNPFYKKNIKVIGKYVNEDAYQVVIFGKEVKSEGRELRELGLI